MFKITVETPNGTFEHETDEYMLIIRSPDGLEIMGRYNEGFEEEAMRDIPTPK